MARLATSEDFKRYGASFTVTSVYSRKEDAMKGKLAKRYVQSFLKIFYKLRSIFSSTFGKDNEPKANSLQLHVA
jgi:hypothetical protein